MFNAVTIIIFIYLFLFYYFLPDKYCPEMNKIIDKYIF